MLINDRFNRFKFIKHHKKSKKTTIKVNFKVAKHIKLFNEDFICYHKNISKVFLGGISFMNKFSCSFYFFLAITSISYSSESVEKALIAIINYTQTFRATTPEPGKTHVYGTALVRASYDGKTKTVTGLALKKDADKVNPSHLEVGKVTVTTFTEKSPLCLIRIEDMPTS